MSQLHYILNRLPIGVVMLDAECRVAGYSGAASAIFGEAALREALGKEIYAVHSPSARSKIEWMLRQAQDSGDSGVASMLIDMPNKVLQLRVIQLKNAGGTSGYCLVLYDVGELDARAVQTDPVEAAIGQPLLKLPISAKHRIELLDVDQVAFLRAEGHYTQVHTGAEQLFCHLSLSQLAARLPRDRFVRVHRSYIVNVAQASAICQRDDQCLILMGGHPEHDIPVSRGNVPRLRHLLGL